MFREYFGLSRQDEAGAPAQKLRNGLNALVENGGFSDSRVKEIGCVLGRLLSVTFVDDWDYALDGADSEVVCNMSFLAIRDLLLVMAKDRRFAEIALKELTPAEYRQMIQSLLSVGDLPSELPSIILAKSQGNPLFVEEVIRSLIDSGVIFLENDEWNTSTDAVEVAIPETVYGIILSRVDRLEENLKHLLQSASVIGRLFGRRLLETISKTEHELDESLCQLEDQSFIYQERAVPEQEYAFKHVMARDAVYEGIVKRTRVRFHAQGSARYKVMRQKKRKSFSSTPVRL